MAATERAKRVGALMRKRDRLDERISMLKVERAEVQAELVAAIDGETPTAPITEPLPEMKR